MEALDALVALSVVMPFAGAWLSYLKNRMRG